MDMPPSLTGLPAWIYAIFLAAIAALSSLLTYLGTRRKIPSEIHVSEMQAQKTLAEAGKIKVDGDVSLINVAISMAKANHEDVLRLRAELEEQAGELKECRKHAEECDAELAKVQEQVRILEKQLGLSE